MRKLKQVWADQRGIAAVELGMLLGMITLAILGGFTGLGTGVTASYTNTAQKMADATP